MESKQSSNFQNDLTEGSVAKQLVRFSVPFFLSMLVQQSYAMIDMVIVSHFAGEASVAGVNNGGQLMFLAAAFAIGISIGGTVLVGQYFGAKRTEDVQKTTATTLTAMLVMSFIMMAIFLPLSNLMLRTLRVPEESYSEAFRYLVITLCGLPFIFMYNAISGILRGMGDTKRPLLFITGASIFSAVLDLILIGIFRLDAAGAAISTVAAQAGCVFVSAIYLTRKGFIFDFKPKSFVIHKDKLMLILKLGVPTGFSQLVINFSFLLMVFLVNDYGVSVAAGAGLVGRFNGLVIMPLIAIGSSVSTMCAQNFGANRFDRAIHTMKVGTGISLALAVFCFVTVQLFPGAIMSLFTSSEAVINAGIIYMRAYSFDYLAVAFFFSLNGLIGGAGHANITLIAALISSIGIRIPAALILSKTIGLGLYGIGLAVPAATLGATIFLAAYYFSGRWRSSLI